jgi:hypothetical protein
VVHAVLALVVAAAAVDVAGACVGAGSGAGAGHGVIGFVGCHDRMHRSVSYICPSTTAFLPRRSVGGTCGDVAGAGVGAGDIIIGIVLTIFCVLPASF